MKFICERTSLDRKRKPCKESVKEKRKLYAYRTKSKAEMKNLHPDEDFSNYEDFLTKDGKTYCREEYDGYRYTIEIDNLEQLMNFIKKYGEVVIYEDNCEDLPTLEIYDTWRE